MVLLGMGEAERCSGWRGRERCGLVLVGKFVVRGWRSCPGARTGVLGSGGPARDAATTMSILANGMRWTEQHHL